MTAGIRLVLPLAAAGLLAACGGGGGHAGQSGSPGNPLPSKLTPKTVSGRSNEASGVATQHAATTPCSLVSRTQATAIVGERVRKPQPGAQGPMCVYRSRHSFVTVAVQTLDLAQLKRRLGRVRHVRVSSRPAICGNYGQQMLYVPLDTRSVLTVAAPCAQAERFAALAVKRLSR